MNACDRSYEAMTVAAMRDLAATAAYLEAVVELEAAVHSRAAGPFVRAHDIGHELVVGQWALIPHFAKSAKLPYQTNNARSEELASKASYRQPWQRGQRCIIPAMSFDEPCWETGRNVWWQFQLSDGAPWGLADLWNTWIEPATGEVLESYTMLTINADEHPLMRRMHKPDPKKPATAQDKRSVIPIEVSNVDCWLTGSVEEASSPLRLAPENIFAAKPFEVPPLGGANVIAQQALW